jgi:hypothetical protein
MSAMLIKTAAEFHGQDTMELDTIIVSLNKEI